MLSRKITYICLRIGYDASDIGVCSGNKVERLIVQALVDTHKGQGVSDTIHGVADVIKGGIIFELVVGRSRSRRGFS